MLCTKKIKDMNPKELSDYKNNKQKISRRNFAIEKQQKLILINTENN
jgi:hypothetical protein